MGIKPLTTGFIAFFIALAVGSLGIRKLPGVYTVVLGASTKKPPAQITPSPTPSPTPTAQPTPTPTSKPTPTPRPSPTPIPSPTPSPKPTPVTGAMLDEWFGVYARKESINQELLRKIAYCESKFNQFAKNGDYAGLYQFSSQSWKTTRQAMNADSDTSLRFNAEEAIKTAAFRLATAGPAAWPNCSK